MGFLLLDLLKERPGIYWVFCKTLLIYPTISDLRWETQAKWLSARLQIVVVRMSPAAVT